MPLLETGTMDQVKTGAEPMEAQKKVHVKIIAPQDKSREIYVHPEGNFKRITFGCQIQDGPNKGRFVNLGFFYEIKKETYITWKMKDGDRLKTSTEKEEDWNAKTYLADLKRFCNAIDVNLDKQDIVDCYGKDLLVDIVLQEGQDGEPRNEAKYPKKYKA